jgi:hypothetical protein
MLVLILQVLSEFDLNAIKTLARLGKSKDSTFLVVLPRAATDMSHNPVVQIGEGGGGG